MKPDFNWSLSAPSSTFFALITLFCFLLASYSIPEISKPIRGNVTATFFARLGSSVSLANHFCFGPYAGNFHCLNDVTTSILLCQLNIVEKSTKCYHNISCGLIIKILSNHSYLIPASPNGFVSVKSNILSSAISKSSFCEFSSIVAILYVSSII